VASAAPKTDRARSVTLVLKPGDHCPLCDHAREVLERVGDDHALDVTVLMGGTEAADRAMLTAGAAAITPVVIVDGFAFAYGRLSEAKLRRALSR
jgi:hypothetical protein